MSFSDLDFICFICGRSGRRGFLQSSGKDGATGTHTCANRDACRKRELAKMRNDPAWADVFATTDEVLAGLIEQHKRELRQKQSVIDNLDGLVRWLRGQVPDYDALMQRWRDERVDFFAAEAEEDEYGDRPIPPEAELIAETTLSERSADSTSAPQEVGGDSQVTHPFVPQTPDYPETERFRVSDAVRLIVRDTPMNKLFGMDTADWVEALYPSQGYAEGDE